jgi:hypothetical protein
MHYSPIGGASKWLYYYNQERPHQGYRNMGRKPIEGIEEYLHNVRQEG